MNKNVWIFGVLIPFFVGITTNYFNNYFNNEPKALKLQVTSTVSLQPELAEPINELKVLFDGEELKQPYVSTLELENEGSKDILVSDFESPIEILVFDPVKMLKTKIVSTTPKDIRSEIFIENNRLKVKPQLLNSLDKLTFSLVTSGGKPEFSPYARIAGIKSINFKQNVKEKDEINIPTGIIFFIISILSLYVCLYFVDKFSTKRKVEIDWKMSSLIIPVMLLTGAVTNVIFLKYIGIETSTSNVFISAVITTILISIVLLIQFKIPKSKVAVVAAKPIFDNDD
ncbi:hypothetical protein [Methylotenera versatilis]|uniref:hypothetical protein n=1 Tax=Methylotenera versatilis TaxID=1055487 RepID=UPI000648E35A|nr:hypothetical protein [Methylotenera versatilis]